MGINKHPAQDFHELIILQIIEEKQPISLLSIYSTIGKDKKLLISLDFDKFKNIGSSLRKEPKQRVDVLLKGLKKKKLITQQTDENDVIKYSLTEEGIKYVVTNGLSGKKEENKPKEEGTDFIKWTNPVFKPENSRWEFYRQDQDNHILEIFHSQSEEEIKEIHKSKVMSHIIAAMKGPLVEGEEVIEHKDPKEEKKLNIPTKQLNLPNAAVIVKEENKEQSPKKNIKADIIVSIMRLKLEGRMYHDIVNEIKKDFPNISLLSIGLYYSQALNEIRVRAADHIQSTVENHIERYEYLFKWFEDNGYSRLSVKALERKEKLVGLHGPETSQLFILNKLIDKNIGVNRYDWERLSESEYCRLLELAKKCVIILQQALEEDQSISGSSS